MKMRMALGLSLLATSGMIAWGQEAAGGRGRGGAAVPASAPATQAKATEPRNDSSTTTGVLHPSGKAEMGYTAVAGYMPMKDESDKLRANIFYVSYTESPKDSAAATTAPTPTVGAAGAGAEKRPITFVFNGGPGAASVWLHLGAVGPRRIDMPADGMSPRTPARLVENEFSWLPATDLVFIDPVNTGYSRAATPELGREFFGVQEDITAVGEFVRLYLTKQQRWGSPVYLAGESYGTTRAAALSNYLQDRVGVSVSGVILISTVLNFATLQPGENNDIPYALYLPSYTAVAAYHQKVTVPQAGGLPGLIKSAEEFALNDYMVALAKGAALPEAEKQRVAKRLSELTGLSTEYVLLCNLRINPARFEKELLRRDGVGKVIGRFDGRMSGWSIDAANDAQEYDPSLTGFYSVYSTAFNEYARQTLKYENDLPYEVLSGRVQPWNYASGGATNSYLYVADDLRDAMTQNPQMRLLVCSGQYDLATPYFATEYTLGHMTLAPDIRKNITHAYYPGGHMLYHVKSAMEKLYQDVTGFYQAGGPGAGGGAGGR